MTQRRKDETIEEARARHAANRRRQRWEVKQRTINAEGKVVSETQRPRPTLKPQKVAGPATIKFTTTVYDRDGRPDRQFVREEPEKVAREALWNAISAELRKDLPPVEPIPAPAPGDGAHLLTTYPVGDHHLGMLAWPPETGAPYDVAISEALLTKAMTNLVARAPASDTALIAILGDFFHYDSFDTVTPKGRNQLDSDTRYPKMIQAGLRVVHTAIRLALQKHQDVHVIVESGNHDPATSIFLALSLADKYADEPRVHIDTSPRNCHYFIFGKVLLGTHHGDKIKGADLPMIMARDQAAAWGITEWRYWYVGHVHHADVKEIMGVLVETFGILAPGDAYSNEEGYRPVRMMKAITYHKDFGEVSRLIVNPQMLEAASA